MQPDKQHKQYADMTPVWELMRDTAIGARAVKAKGSTYLPRLGGQTSDRDPGYQSYKQRAEFFDAVSRTIDTMSGHIFRKQPTIEIPAAMEDFKNDINMAGISLEGFASNLVEEVIEVGRVGILVDFPAQSESDSPKTVVQAQSEGMRPYLTCYEAENIINWKMGRVNNATVLTQVFLSETYEDESGEEQEQIRELFLDWYYGQNIWRRVGEKNEWVIVETLTPQMNGQDMHSIPFFIVAPREKGVDVQKPPLEGLANTAISHYRNSADYENGIHKSGLPTLVVTGVEPKYSDGKEAPQEFHLGTDTAIVLPEGGDAKFIQCGESGFVALENAMAAKEKKMAAQGARMLENEVRMAESAEAQTIKRGGEMSVLGSIAASVEQSITKALQVMAAWLGVTGEVTFTLNKDYIPSPMDAQMFAQWTNSYLSGAISYETYFEGLIKGELVNEDLSAEDEQERMSNQSPALGGMNDDQ